MKIRLSIILILLSFAYLLAGSIQSLAQTSEVVVPDLTGLNVPQAAAALNRVGLALGSESAGLWTSTSGIPENTIGSQSITPGGSTAPGTSIDIILLRTPNITLIYDDNDLTMMNRDNRRVDFTNLVFNTLESATNASFNASRWSGRLRGGYCTQLWSVGRSNAKDVDGCKGIDNWLTTNNPAEHFWTASNGVKNFSVVQDGVERAICEAASSDPKTCDFYLETAGQSDSAEFVYFAYSADRLIIRNRTIDQWMRLNRSVIHNHNPNPGGLGQTFEPGDPNLFGKPQIVAKIQRLAPGQCLLFVQQGAVDAAPPEDCDVIATLELSPDQVFWVFDFELQSIADDKLRLCRAASPDKLTICILPR